MRAGSKGKSRPFWTGFAIDEPIAEIRA